MAAGFAPFRPQILPKSLKRNEAVTVAKLTGEVRAGETAPDAPE